MEVMKNNATKKFEKPPGLTDVRGKYTKKSPTDTSISYTNLHIKPRVKQTTVDSSSHTDPHASDSKSTRGQPLASSTPYLSFRNGSNKHVSLNNVSCNNHHAFSKKFGESELPVHTLVNPSGVTTVAISCDGRLILPQIPDQNAVPTNAYFQGVDCVGYPVNNSLSSLNQYSGLKAPVYQADPAWNIANRLALEAGQPGCVNDTDNSVVLDSVQRGKDPQLELLLQEISNQLLLSAKQREQRPSCLPLPVSSILVQNDPEDPLGMRHRLPAQFKSFERYLEVKFGMDEQPTGSIEELCSSSKEDCNSRKKSIFSQLNAHIRSASPSKAKNSSKPIKNKPRMECPLPKVPIGNSSFDRPSISTVNPNNLAVLAADSFNHTADSFSSLSSNSTNPYPMMIGDEYATSPSDTSETYSYISDCPAINETSIFRGTLSQSNSHMDQLDRLTNHLRSSTDHLPTDSTMLIRPGPSNLNSNRLRGSSVTPPSARPPQSEGKRSGRSRSHRSKFSEEEASCYNNIEESSGSSCSQSFSSSLDQIAAPSPPRPRIHRTPELFPNTADNPDSEEPTYQNLIHNRWDFSFPMVAFQQLPELIWTDCDFWYSKLKDCLEADYTSDIDLPPHWSTGRSKQGRLYLAHDETRQTTWFHPVLGPRVPFGWERVDTLREGVYYHNLFVRHSQRHHPNLWIVPVLKSGNIEDENCFKVLRSLQQKSKPIGDIGETSLKYYSALPGIHEQKFTLNVRKLSLSTLTKVNADLDELFFRELRSVIVAYETYRSAIVKELSRRRLLLKDKLGIQSKDNPGDQPRHKPPPQIAYNSTSTDVQLHRLHEMVRPPPLSHLPKDVDSSDWSSDDEDSV